MVTLPLVLLLAVPAARPFADERLLLDRRLEALRRILPDGPQPAADVAGVALFLASDDSAWMTGQTLYIDGGASMRAFPDRASFEKARGRAE